MKISAKTRYGLEAMVYLAKKDEYKTLEEISESQKIPFSYLEKIMSKLEKKKLVSSRKGPQGGYKIIKPLKEISVGDIVRALEDKYHLVFCLAASGKCGKEGKCLAKSVWMKVQRSMEKTFDSITLDTL